MDIKKSKSFGIAETVYDSLLGQLIPEYHLSWVENIFVSGHPCYEHYCDMRQAYERLLKRLNKTDEDRDVEDITNAMMIYGKIAALEMFKYGIKYQKMMD